MKIKVNTIRTKLILAIFKSVGLAGLCMLGIGLLLIIASGSFTFAKFFHQHFVMFMLLLFCLFVVLTMVFYLVTIRKGLQYLEEITATLEVIAGGNLAIHVPVRTGDELGKMADTVNMMACRLTAAIEEERQLEKSKHELITNLSHDLRTPLTSTLGYLELIRNMTWDKEPALRRYIHIAHGKCQDLKRLIDHLFEYTKLHQTDMSIQQVTVNMGELLEQVVIGFIPALKEADMTYRLFFTNDKLMVKVDPMLLTRVFNNLIANAIHHGKDGAYLDIHLTKKNSHAVIQIINDGKPISDTDLPHVFDRFYQADPSRSAGSRHAGLGLAIVKRIIDMHKGTVTAFSLQDKTVFEIRLKRCI